MGVLDGYMKKRKRPSCPAATASSSGASSTEAAAEAARDVSAEIDDIFGDFSAKKKALDAVKEAKREGTMDKKQKKGTPKDAFDDMMADTSGEGTGKKRKYTEEGFPIFTEEELKINLPGSGQSKECPFDCRCCY